MFTLIKHTQDVWYNIIEKHTLRTHQKLLLPKYQ